MTTLTINPMRSYSRPTPHYPARADFYPRTTWELADGAYKRVFFSASSGRTRTAWVERALGGWRWKVMERWPRGHVAMIAIGSNDGIKPLARMCFGAAPFVETIVIEEAQ